MKYPRTLPMILALQLFVGACVGNSGASDTTMAEAAPSTTVPPTTTSTTTLPAVTTTTTTTIPSPEPLPIEPPEGYELVWNDEFDGDVVNSDNWVHELGGWGWGNGEAQYYTDRVENSRVQNGLLVIELHQEKYETSYYTSARMVTQGKQAFQYGYVEARIKVPAGIGTWPAFWMLGDAFGRDAADPLKSNWPHVGEIDIMEHLGREPDLVMGTVHGPGYAGAGSIGRWNRQDFPIADEFHTYAIDWDQDGIRWYFDGEQYFDLSRDGVNDREWVFDAPFFIILNLALGGSFGGTIALDLELPLQMYIDHVRVFQRIDEG